MLRLHAGLIGPLPINLLPNQEKSMTSPTVDTVCDMRQHSLTVAFIHSSLMTEPEYYTFYQLPTGEWVSSESLMVFEEAPPSEVYWA